VLATFANVIYLATKPADMRKSIDGLSVLVQEGFKLSPFAPAMFAFCNRKGDKIKILRWDESGFWLYYKRLEKGKFYWPQVTSKDDLVQKITERELGWLLEGLSIVQKQAHKKVQAIRVI
jgi:transposase